MPKTSTAITGAAGEHYVMYRLLKLGHLAALTPTGAQGVDILISNADGGNLRAIQVKMNGTEVGKDGWTMAAKHEGMRQGTLFYCLVCPGSPSATAPTCWILPSAVVADHVYASHRAWLAGTPKRGNSRADGDRRKLHMICTNPPLEPYGAGWMNSYREAWHLLDEPVD
jgi:hypothetical protein